MNGSALFEGSPILSGSLNVNTGGNIKPLEVEITENGTQTINAPVGVNGYNPITIETNVPSVEPILDDITITENGTYTPPTGTDGYDEIVVNVPPTTPVLDDITITENGTYTPPTGTDGYDEIIVNVPETPLSSLTATENGTYTAPTGTGYNEVSVNVPAPENALVIKNYEGVPTSIASFNDGTSNPLKSLAASIVPMQAGSGDPSPTNVRPISGWTECNIPVRGINQWDEEWEVGSIDSSTGQNISRNDTFRSKNYIPVKPNTTYYAYCGDILGESNMRLPFYAYDINKNFIGRTTPNDVNNTTFTTPSGCYFIRFRTGIDFPHSDVYQNDITINISDASVNGHYYSYNVNSRDYTIPFLDSQGKPVEVYGGSVDVVNGGGSANKAKLLVSECTWQGGNGVFYTNSVASSIKHGDGRFDHIISSTYETQNVGGVSSLTNGGISVDADGYIQLKDLRYSTAGDFKSNMGTTQLVYELATPTTFYTQPTSIKSLDGENNVWASTGDVEELKYFTRATS